MDTLLVPLGKDAKLVLAACAVRSLDYSLLSVFLGIYLNFLNFSPIQAGLVFGSIMAGAGLSNVVASWRGDMIGRKRMLVSMSMLMVIGGIAFATVTDVVPLVIVGVFAMTTSSGGDRTAFQSLDMSILAQHSSENRRTLVFSWYNLLGFGAKSIGAALIALPMLIQLTFGVGTMASYRLIFILYSVVAGASLLLYSLMGKEAELDRSGALNVKSHKTGILRGTIAKLAGLFSLDSLGGGFMVNSFISYWFAQRFGAELNTIAAIFFFGQLLNGISILMATPMARKIGLINTMAYTQIAANIFMGAMAFTGNIWLAIGLFMARELANNMDIPTRQSYTMAIVPLDARTSAAAVTNLGRNLSQTVSPVLAGFVAQVSFFGAPFVIGSTIKLLYNGLLLKTFKDIRPPEEIAQ